MSGLWDGLLGKMRFHAFALKLGELMFMKRFHEARIHGFRSTIMDKWLKYDIKPTERQFKYLLKRLHHWELEEKRR